MARNKDPEIDAALKDGRSTTDETKRKADYAKIQQRQTQLLPYLWLNHLRWTLAATNNVRGLQGMPLPGGGTSSGLVGGVIPVTAMWLDT
jgi:ABC-type transport system substrate-binding protein